MCNRIGVEQSPSQIDRKYEWIHDFGLVSFSSFRATNVWIEFRNRTIVPGDSNKTTSRYMDFNIWEQCAIISNRFTLCSFGWNGFRYCCLYCCYGKVNCMSTENNTHFFILEFPFIFSRLFDGINDDTIIIKMMCMISLVSKGRTDSVHFVYAFAFHSPLGMCIDSKGARGKSRKVNSLALYDSWWLTSISNVAERFSFELSLSRTLSNKIR